LFNIAAMEVQPRRASDKGPAERFHGDVYIDSIAEGHDGNVFTVGSVHFTPGARTAWHRHGSGQTLYVTEGEGRVQSRGEARTVIRQGDVVLTPAGEWHWHGAAPDHFMTHLAVSEGDPEWGEHISDADYNS
jgi:quercetin dioxygenase-like cupin family protein